MNEQLVVKHIRTKNKVRKIVTYKENGALRNYHENVVKYLNEHTYNSIFAKAYAPHSSIYKNAQAHMYNDIFLKMDIRNFFPGINHRYLAECLFYEINKDTTISRTECYEIVRKCSVGNKGLPLGLVSSPALANLYMKEFDGLLYGKIKKMNLPNPIYTRYADDIVISFKDMPEYELMLEELQQTVKALLRKVYLSANEKKTEIYHLKKSNHVRITGVSITKADNGHRHISVGKKLKNEIFWSAIELYDRKQKSHEESARLKGLFSFALSIEKNGIEDGYSDKMMSLIKDRGFGSLKELIQSLGNE